MLLFGFFLTGLLTVTQLLVEYRKEIQAIENSMEEVRTASLNPVLETTWSMDFQLQKLLLDGVVSNNFISYGAILDERGQIMTESGAPATASQHVLLKTYRLEHTNTRNKTVLIGHLQLEADMAIVFQRLQDRLTVILLTQAFKTLLVSSFLLLVFHRIVTRHLYEIIDFIRYRIVMGRNSRNLCLSRPYKQDELQDITDAINQMQRKLNQSFNRLQQENERRLAAEQELRNYSEELSTLFDTLTDAVLMVCHNSHIRQINSSGLALLGLKHRPDPPASLQELVSFHLTRSPDSPAISLHSIIGPDVPERQAHYTLAGFLRLRANRGEPVPIILTAITTSLLPENPDKARTAPAVTILIIRDESKAEKLKRIAHNATHDHLTGLYNRLALEEYLVECMTGSDSGQYCLAIMDLNKFKQVNDACGHLAGDSLLQRVAETMHDCLGGRDFLARLGGDEFAIIFQGDAAYSKKMATRLIEAIEAIRFSCNDRTFSISAGIGLSPLHGGRNNQKRVMEMADKACYQAKNLPGRIAFLPAISA